jgi:hypothetical protein
MKIVLILLLEFALAELSSTALVVIHHDFRLRLKVIWYYACWVVCYLFGPFTLVKDMKIEELVYNSHYLHYTSLINVSMLSIMSILYWFKTSMINFLTTMSLFVTLANLKLLRMLIFFCCWYNRIVKYKLWVQENRDREDKNFILFSSYMCVYTIAKVLFIWHK